MFVAMQIICYPADICQPAREVICMLRINLTTPDLFLDELNQLKHKRAARNIKEALNIRGFVVVARLEGGLVESSFIFQTMCEIDGEMILFEFRSQRTKPYPPDAPSDEAKTVQAEFDKYHPQVAKHGDLRPGYFDSL